MKKKFDCMVATGKYTGQDGQEKTSWLKVGAVLAKDNGKFVLKLEAIPVGIPEWDGWIQLFEPQERQGQGQQAKPAQNASTPLNDPIPDAMDEDIPF